MHDKNIPLPTKFPECYCGHTELMHMFYHEHCIVEGCHCGRYEEREAEVDA